MEQPFDYSVAHTETELQARLKDLCRSMKENNKLKKEYESKLDQEKREFKELAKKLGCDNYEDEFVKVSITRVEKSSLNVNLTLNYLKENNLTEYIHVKEFFDETELAMAMTQNKIKREDLIPFFNDEIQERINIR